MKQNFAIVCESAIVDPQTNNLYLLGIFSDINSPGVPAVYPKLCIVTNFSGGLNKHQHKITVKHEDGTEIASAPGEIDFGAEGKDAQYIAQFLGLTFPKYGKYYIHVYLDDIEQPLKARLLVKAA